MKKLLLALGVTFLTAGAASAQVEIGLKVSPSITNLRADSPRNGTGATGFKNEKSKVGFGGGVIIDYFFGQNYAFSSGLFLTGKGGTVSYLDPAKNLRYEQKIGIQYLEVPISLKLFTNDISEGTKVYFQVGGTLAGAIAARIDGEKYYTDPGTSTPGTPPTESRASKHVIIPDVGLLGGAGVEYLLGQSTRLIAGLSYHHGIVNIDRYFDNTRKFNNVTLKNSEVALDLGIKF
ncbi:porin family protein [Hymenobacter profundi]|uniref:PorT family protein n=1 Tax=Hymenobacter profundi TaxID=1982110 RepID=A0ABS6X437_9BACT|nr:porin family protein [Hymenobacter profundi]MBW3129793.1 PorT family protein [Hymenobacter profundi]